MSAYISKHETQLREILKRALASSPIELPRRIRKVVDWNWNSDQEILYLNHDDNFWTFWLDETRDIKSQIVAVIKIRTISGWTTWNVQFSE